jgi:uncharacterized protein YecT (DUF1311 family)
MPRSSVARSAVPRSSMVMIRRGLIALGGGGCVALCAALLATAARPHLDTDAPVRAARPMIIDGPPTQVEAAPPPVRPSSRRVHRRIEPSEDDDDYEHASAAAQAWAGAPMPPPQPAGGAQTDQAQAQAQTQGQGQGQGQGRAQAQASDPCAGASGPAEQMICSYPRLNAADATLQRLYNMDLYRTDDPDGLREEQRRWRAVRDQVAAEDGPQALAELYAERMQELDGPY